MALGPPPAKVSSTGCRHRMPMSFVSRKPRHKSTSLVMRCSRRPATTVSTKTRRKRAIAVRRFIRGMSRKMSSADMATPNSTAKGVTWKFSSTASTWYRFICRRGLRKRSDRSPSTDAWSHSGSTCRSCAVVAPNQKNSGCLPEERAWLDKVFGDYGWVDAFRTLDQEPEQYTWWSNRGAAWDNNVGWRIDYHVVTPGLKDKVSRTHIYKEQRFSDHAPLMMDYDWSHDG